MCSKHCICRISSIHLHWLFLFLFCFSVIFTLLQNRRDTFGPIEKCINKHWWWVNLYSTLGVRVLRYVYKWWNNRNIRLFCHLFCFLIIGNQFSRTKNTFCRDSERKASTRAIGPLECLPFPPCVCTSSKFEIGCVFLALWLCSVSLVCISICRHVFWSPLLQSSGFSAKSKSKIVTSNTNSICE